MKISKNQLSVLGTNCSSMMIHLLNEKIELAGKIAEIVKIDHLSIETCADQVDLREIGIAHGSSVNKDLIEQLIGCKLKVNKDRNQREVSLYACDAFRFTVLPVLAACKN